MSKTSIFDHEWIDLVFEGRNQKYGAYQLRRQDSKTTAIALFSGIALMVVAVGLPALFSGRAAFVDKGGIVVAPADPDIFEIPLPEAPKPEPINKPTDAQPDASAPSAQPTIKFTGNLVATPDPVTPDIPDMDDLQNAVTSTATTPGNPNGGNPMSNAPTGVPGGTGTQGTTAGNSDAPLLAVDEAPAFPGGLKKFYEEVSRKFRTPDMDREITLKVYVSFVVERDGSLTNIKVINDPGHGVGKEALRVLQAIKTKWKPGKMKGQAVRTAYNLPIIVKVN
jgi:protein TonB